MFKFLKVFSTEEKAPEVETMRARFERVTQEMNELIADLGGLTQVTLDVEAGRIELAAPEQFPDEALALPKPDSSNAAQKEAADESTHAESETGEDKSDAKTPAEKAAAA